MVRWHIIDDRRRQESCLINCPRTKMSAHASTESDSSRKCHHYSDTLLVESIARNDWAAGDVLADGPSPGAWVDASPSRSKRIRQWQKCARWLFGSVAAGL